MKAVSVLLMTGAGLTMIGSTTAQTTNPDPAGAPRQPAAKVTATASGRITAPPVAEMNEEQRREYDNTLRTFGGPVGPRMPLINSPEVAQAWQGMQAALTKSALPRKLREVAILAVARVWKSEFEWYVHAKEAVRFGVDPAAVEAIRVGKEPSFATADEQIVYRYSSELLVSHHVTDATYQAAWRLLGTRTLVDLTVLLGHYSSVSMMLNAHEVPLPDGVARSF